MFRFAAVVFAAALTQACSQQTHNTDDPSAVLIRNVTVISADRESPLANADVLIRNGKIEQVGASLESEGATVIDGSGKFLSPGLIDSHVHLSFVPGMSYDQEQEFPTIVETAHQQIPRSYLFHGFTTLIDLNADADSFDAWNKTEIHPKVYFCGGAPIMDGYPTRFIPAPLRYRIAPNFIMEDGQTPPEGIDPADHTPQAVAARIKGGGAICIKTFYEDGFGARNDWPTPSAGLIRRLRDAAHALDMPLVMHANEQKAQAFGVETGVDAFAHGMWTWDNYDEIVINEKITAILDSEIIAGIATQPTIQVLYGERDLHDPDYLSQEALKDVVPQALLDWYASESGQAYRNELATIPYLAEPLAKGDWASIDAEPIARVTAATDYLNSHGGKLLFGSDTPSDVTYANPPGLNGRVEVDRLLEAGLSAAQIFRAATLGNAVFFGLGDEIGTIAEGKQADLLLMRENPLETITAFDSIEMVIVDGKIIDRETLSARH